MKMNKNLGIWMDHRNANLIEFKSDAIESKTIESKFTHEEKVFSLVKSESIMHNKQQQQQSEYYQKIAEVITNYNKVILFGPTDAKAELLNLLKADSRFEKIKIEVKQADKMTDNQQQAFVREYFSKS